MNERTTPSEAFLVHGYYAALGADGNLILFARSYLTAQATAILLRSNPSAVAILATGSLHGEGTPHVARGMADVIREGGISHDRVIIPEKTQAKHTAAEVQDHLKEASRLGISNLIAVGFSQHLPTIQHLHHRRGKSLETASVEEVIRGCGSAKDIALLSKLLASKHERSFVRYNRIVRLWLKIDPGYRWLSYLADKTRNDVQSSVYPGVLRHVFAPIDMPLPDEG
jgi:hypothetical protein